MVHALSPTMTLRDFENGYWYLERWMESLQAAVAPLGITTTRVANYIGVASMMLMASGVPATRAS